ncbi:NADH-quinone oxidoreductase subunit J [Sulfuriflexus sp.]|uniref:NADH-quinone oxidoreductase subunit J n=1 Tax=Sulfuriflexus sp. TaxID=2015443 RepID=UPI0028CE6EFE|nr:NADH-quinone oxidoreductase subunit J [Sulfuriflexus sp.]MDT8403061.1 NADH-quinone oxidoreductase subunit J [Sulfuriflexus sp.]
MTIEQLTFYVFASILVFAAVMVITVRNPVHASLFLVVAFFNSAVLWLLLEAEFLAITLVLVYVGAVMVLFLFVIMMLDINIARLREGFAKYLPIATLVAFIMVVEMVFVVGPGNFGLEQFAEPARHSADFSNTRALGSVLYTVYLYPFEIAAAILLVAIVAAISLTLRRRPGTRHQEIDKQVAVRAADRLRIVKMDSEKQE